MANKKRLIDAIALLKKEKWDFRYQETLHYVRVIDIEDAPTVDAVEVVHGRWTRKQIGKYTGVDEVCCSICDYFIGVVASDTGFREAIEGMNYCPNCGADMRGDSK